MKGDFTRGIEPDRKRGKRYRRVLVQQSRVLLDSDAAALVDALDHELREVTADLGCELGSPDYGFLLTPGRLLALFEHVDHIIATAPATATRDYSRKYPEEPNSRYPSLRITGAGAVVIPLVEPIIGPVASHVAFWYRADAAVTITVAAGTSSTTIALPVATSWTRMTAPVAVAAGITWSTITITGATDPVWIALCELHEDRQNGPHFWAAAGRFHARGWTPALVTGTGYPELSYPAAAGFAASEADFALGAPQPSIVAYLETWERAITAAEDPGIREAALGRIDTTVRTQIVGQVKWASAGSLTPAELQTAFDHIAGAASTLTVSAPTTPPSSDPCALPITGGYTGADHRLYRFEVHAGGAALVARIKWSRDNASAVFSVRDLSGAVVTLDRESGLAAGDIVEVLSEVVDLGDVDRATVTSGGVVPPLRRSGVLVRLADLGADSQGRDRFELHDLANPALTFAPASDAVRYPTVAGAVVPLRLRRWEDVATQATVGGNIVAKIEDGIEITLAGTFRTGEYWQFEARRGVQNDNGTWRASPHGPERVFAPLAVFDITTAPATPLFLRAWLDDRFSSLCELDADDIAFDGVRIGSDADTVQEAIEELYERDAGNCCDATLGPNGPTGDDTLRILAAINATTFPDGGHLCLEPGVYDIHTPIVIDRSIVVRGCPEAVLYGRTNAPIFDVKSTGRLRIEQLILSSSNGPTELVLLRDGARFTAREVGFLNDSLVAIRQDGALAIAPDMNANNDPVFDPDNLPPREDAGVEVELRDCVLLAKRGIDVGYARFLSAARCAFVFSTAGIGAQQIDQLVVGDCSFRDGPAALWTPVAPELLRSRTDDILDAVAALGAGNGCGIAVEFLFGAILERNKSRSRIYAWSRVAREVSARDDESERLNDDGAIGYRFHHARRVDIEGARVAAWRCIQIPLSARQLGVRSCQLAANGTGIDIAGENPDLVNAGSIIGVNLDGNHVASGNTGITVGAAGTKGGVVDDVRIGSNIVRIVSNLAAAAAIIAVADQNRLDAVIVEGNDITTDQRGIQCSGVGMVIRGNQIRITSAGPAIGTIAIAPMGQISVVDNLIMGVSNQFSAISLQNVPDARVTGNQVRTTAAEHILDIPSALNLVGASASQRHYIANNDFAVGGVTITNAHELSLIGNAIRLLNADSGANGKNGLVHGNKLGAIVVFIIPISAVFGGLRGMWKISDNVAPAIMQIRGASHQEALWNGAFDDFVAIGRLREHMVEMPIGDFDFASSAATATTGAATVPGGLASNGILLRDRDMPTYSSPAYSPANPPWEIDRITGRAELEAVRPIREWLDLHDVIIAARLVPDPLDVHVSGNRVGILLVEPSATPPPAGTTIHVVDNKVTLNLDLRGFTTAMTGNVVALNSATNVVPPAFATIHTAIASPNLDY